MRASCLRFTAIATGGEPRGNPFVNEIPPALAFSSNGRSLFWAGNDQNVHLTEIGTGKETLRIEPAGLNGPICGLTLSPDGKTLAVGRTELSKPEIRVELWSTAMGEAPSMRSSLPTAPSAAMSVRFSFFVGGSGASRCPGLLTRRHYRGRRGSPQGRRPALFDVATAHEINGPGEAHLAAVQGA